MLEKRRGEFLIYDDGYRVRRHSYADVTRAARGFAARMAAHGVAKGDKVLLWGENCPEWIACYWGIQLLGAIAVPIDYRSSLDFATRIRDIVQARLVLAGDDVDSGATRARRRPGRWRAWTGRLMDRSPRLPSIETTLRRSSSPPAPPQIPKAW